jgi:uncharacterized protein involved in exopolysaccharide biosynthesis
VKEHRGAQPAPEHVHEGLDIIDLAKARDYAGFVVRSVRRHPWAAAGTLVAVMAMTLLGLVISPRTYHVEAQLLAQRNLVMPALGNPGRNVPQEADAPTRAAPETVLRRDNLISLVKQTSLLERWDGTRAPLIKARDAVVRLFTGAPTAEERMEMVIEMLEEQLYVVAGDGTVTIGIDWPDPHLAFHLVETAQENFLDARHAAEISSIAEAIAILERHASEVQLSVDAALEEIKRLEPTHAERAALIGTSTFRPPKPKEPSPQDSEFSQLKTLLEGKRQAIRDLEAFRSRRLAELKRELEKEKQVYTDAYPNVAQLKESIAAMATDSPQLAELRRDEQELAAAYTRAGRDRPPERENEIRIATPQKLIEARRVLSSGSDASAEQYAYAKARLRFAMSNYDSLIERLDAARIELDTAQASFKYRYSSIRPAEFPKRMAKPKVPVVIAFGLFMGLILAALVAALLDLRSRRLVERWQVERLLGLPVLGEIPHS